MGGVALAILAFGQSAHALPVLYSAKPSGSLMLMKSCEDSSGRLFNSEVRLLLNASNLRTAASMPLRIEARLCVLFAGEISRTFTFESFPMKGVLATLPNRSRRLPLTPIDTAKLKSFLETDVRSEVDVRASLYAGELTYEVGVLSPSGVQIAEIKFSLNDEMAQSIPGYDFETQLPIVAFSASYKELGIYTRTQSTQTLGLGRLPIAKPIAPCTLWGLILTIIWPSAARCQW